VPVLSDLVLSFPTVVYVALSLVCSLYWMLVILGAVDVDGIDAAVGKVSAVDGVVAGLKGGSHAIADALAAAGLAKVPLTVSLTLFGLFGAFVSLSTSYLLGPIVPSFLTALISTICSVVGAGLSTAVAVRPLAGLFADGASSKAGGRAMIGRSVTITIDADDHSGQARTDDEGIVSVRCAPGQRLARGEEGILMDVSDDGVFLVEATRLVLPSTADALAALAASSSSSPAPNESVAEVATDPSVLKR
jgi:hypothetical protein